MKKGKLIVIEGTDGSGKGTQLNLLIDHLKDSKTPYAAFDFPQYEKTFFGNFVGRFLNGEFGHISRINPYLAMFPYAGDRWQVKGDLDSALETKKIVICNRYAPSIAYQLAKVKPKEREAFLAWAAELEYKTFKIPQADYVIFLYVPFKVAQKLIEQKASRSYLKGKSKDQYEENIKYLQKVEKMYLFLEQYYKNWIKIDCINKKGELKSREEIFNEILSILKKKKVI